jgi:hypothetical protein
MKCCRHFFETVVFSLLEYACPVWHNNLTVEQSDLIDNIQKRALKKTYGSIIIDDQQMCHLYKLPTLSEGRETV